MEQPRTLARGVSATLTALVPAGNLLNAILHGICLMASVMALVLPVAPENVRETSHTFVIAMVCTVFGAVSIPNMRINPKTPVAAAIAAAGAVTMTLATSDIDTSFEAFILGRALSAFGCGAVLVKGGCMDI
ncbi:hypothetical protein KIPB_005561 [Kipferlia bialata]|uniref:Uncharacterized protein n=1 Tax=Kipferlia bialata TaxID=797122 RepID=A0A9K3GHG5_9EUKA|nr:hypothetical protein KIPB_005561 [Kipferlia bialata]|eukprot:g5561.t1